MKTNLLFLKKTFEEKGYSFNLTPEHISAFFSLGLFEKAKKERKTLKELLQNEKKTLEESFGKYFEIKEENNFLNFYPKESFLRNFLKEKFEKKLEKKERYLIEYSAPNIAKHMHVGHLRSTILGEVLARFFEQEGYKVVRMNYFGDWGTQFGKLIYEYKKTGNEKKLKEKGIDYLFSLYVDFNKKETPELLAKARKEFEKLEKGDKENLRLWKLFYDVSIKEFENIYSFLDIKYDVIRGESDYRESARKVVEDALEKKIAWKDNGAVVVRFEDLGTKLSTLLLQKTDETTIYASRDIASLKERFESLKADKLIYVVSSQQDLHFKQIFEIAELLGYGKKENLEHVNYELIFLPEGKMTTRTGIVVFARDLINNLNKKARETIREKNPNLSDKEIDEIAGKITKSTICFEILKYSRNRKIIFNMKEALDFKGDTAAYLLYSYVRAKKIISKSKKNADPEKKTKFSKEEIKLLKEMFLLDNFLTLSFERREPSFLANYCLSLSRKFNDFYEKKRVLGSDEEEGELAVVEKFVKTLEKIFLVLNLEKLDKM